MKLVDNLELLIEELGGSLRMDNHSPDSLPFGAIYLVTISVPTELARLAFDDPTCAQQRVYSSLRGIIGPVLLEHKEPPLPWKLFKLPLAIVKKDRHAGIYTGQMGPKTTDLVIYLSMVAPEAAEETRKIMARRIVRLAMKEEVKACQKEPQQLEEAKTEEHLPLPVLPEGQLTEIFLFLPSDILAYVALVTGVSAEKILGKGRTERIAKARSYYCFALREILNLGYKEIGRLTNRDHTTAIHAVQKASLDTEAWELITMIGQVVERRPSVPVFAHRIFRDEVQQWVAQQFGVTIEQMYRGKAEGYAKYARWCYWFILRIVFKLTYTEIAKMDGYDHTSIMGGIRKLPKEFPPALLLAERIPLAETPDGAP